jgi:cellulose synthase/poly-beta-1,6-N-acetylglucosamine synthase-like glycosyltransferase
LRVVALIPAHNEEAGIGACLDALAAQARPPDETFVVSDNCTDETEQIVLSRGDVGLIRTVGNRDKKAGALNQALDVGLGQLEPFDVVLVVDADSILAPSFVKTALDYLGHGYSAVGGNFRGQPGAGFLGMCQRNEYARYARDVARLKGRCLVLTGTATAFCVSALQEVAHERGTRLPGARGLVYDTTVLTEDNEMTFALRTLGHHVLSPKGCVLTTEVMPTWRDLARQRLRWKRGAFENLRQYGLNRLTAPYWGRQALALAGILVTVGYFASLVYGAIVGMHLHPLWIGVSGIFMVERAVTVRERGWRMMLVGAALVPEFLYDSFLQVVQAYAYAGALLRRGEDW